MTKLSRYFVCAFCPNKATRELFKLDADGAEHGHTPACDACARERSSGERA